MPTPNCWRSAWHLSSAPAGDGDRRPPGTAQPALIVAGCDRDSEGNVGAGLVRGARGGRATVMDMTGNTPIQERFLPGTALDAAPIAGATTSHRPIVTTIAVR